MSENKYWEGVQELSSEKVNWTQVRERYASTLIVTGHTQCHRQGGGGNRGSLSRAPSVRGSPNSAGLVQIHSCIFD